MRRLLIAIPAASLAIGFFLLAWNYAVETDTPQRADRPPTVAVPAPLDPVVSPVEPEPPPKPIPSGSIQIFVHTARQPVEGAKIYLVSKSTRGRMQPFETRDNGFRVVENMPVGRYSISAFHPGLIPGRAHVEIKEDRKTPVEIELKQGSRIFGTVTDRGGNAVADARVFLTRNRVTTSLYVKTDGDGKYDLGGISPGEYGVRVNHDKFKSWDRQGNLVFRNAGDGYQVDAELELGSMVSGRVLTLDGKPIAEARVIVTNDGGGGGGLAKTDEDGRFAVYGLANRGLTVAARAATYGTTFARGVLPNTTGLEIRLPEGGEISGNITVPGAIPPSFVVMLSRYDEHFEKKIKVEPRTFTSSKDGAFRMPDVAPGIYWLEVHAEGYEGVDEPQVVVRAGQTTDNVVIRLQQRSFR